MQSQCQQWPKNISLSLQKISLKLHTGKKKNLHTSISMQVTNKQDFTNHALLETFYFQARISSRLEEDVHPSISQQTLRLCKNSKSHNALPQF